MHTQTHTLQVRRVTERKKDRERERERKGLGERDKIKDSKKKEGEGESAVDRVGCIMRCLCGG